MQNLLDLIQKEIISFFTTIKNEKWFGKEREIISRFAFSNLLDLVNADARFYSPGQIGIEVRVKQIDDSGKKEVCKDLVVWKFPYQTAWSQDNSPLLIVEWKCNNKNIFKGDADWLEEYVRQNPATIGIAVNIDNKGEYSLKAALIENGKPVDMEWINL